MRKNNSLSTELMLQLSVGSQKLYEQNSTFLAIEGPSEGMLTSCRRAFALYVEFCLYSFKQKKIYIFVCIDAYVSVFNHCRWSVHFHVLFCRSVFAECDTSVFSAQKLL